VQPRLRIENLEKVYEIKSLFKPSAEIRALRGVSLELFPGETLAIVGESGCGKSTLAKLLMKIESISSGRAQVDGKDLSSLSQKELPQFVQMIFQDPYSSLNPRKRIGVSIAEPLVIQGQLTKEAIQKRVTEVATSVGLRPEILERYPHMLSGGQRQRVGIARALITAPRVMICDEPVSALDVSVQSQVINLLLDLQKETNMSYLFISHDLGVVRFIAHRVAVMYLGRIVELGTKEQIFTSARHPYTQLLLKSSPYLHETADFEDVPTGELPSPLKPPSGCAFRTRCPFANELCAEKAPDLRSYKGVHVACHHAEKIS